VAPRPFGFFPGQQGFHPGTVDQFIPVAEQTMQVQSFCPLTQGFSQAHERSPSVGRRFPVGVAGLECRDFAGGRVKVFPPAEAGHEFPVVAPGPGGPHLGGALHEPARLEWRFVVQPLHNDPYDYLVDVLQRVGQHPASEVAQLTPRLWKQHFAANPLRSDLYPLTHDLHQ